MLKIAMNLTIAGLLVIVAAALYAAYYFGPDTTVSVTSFAVAIASIPMISAFAPHSSMLFRFLALVYLHIVIAAGVLAAFFSLGLALPFLITISGGGFSMVLDGRSDVVSNVIFYVVPTLVAALLTGAKFIPSIRENTFSALSRGRALA